MTGQDRGIVVAADGSPSSVVAVEWAAKDAEMRGVPLLLVHVVAPIVTAAEGWPGAPVSADYTALQEEQAEKIIAQARDAALRFTSPGRESQITTEARRGPVVPELVGLSDGAEMMVVGCRGQGAVAQTVLGSVSSALAHHARCPVAIIHDEDPLTARSPEAPVVLGVDGSPTSELATAIAFDEASRRGVELIALHAWSDMGPIDFASVNWAPIEWRNIKDREEEVLAERLAGYHERYPDVRVIKVVVCDQPSARLLEHAQLAQLVVVGSHGRGGFAGMLLGSVSSAVLSSARVPVVIARTAG